MIVGVIGSGAWGTALAIVAAAGGADVVLWSFDGCPAEFDGVTRSDKIRVVTDMADLATADVWLAVTPSAFFRDTIARARPFYRGVPVIICTKGADRETDQFMSGVLRDALPECTEYGVLSGPQFAAEAASGIPTGSTLAGTPGAIAAGTSALCKMYISPSDDIIGTEICGVGKNAVALICGYLTATAGENERALIFTRAWGEVMSIGRALGARIETFSDLCGIGDLYLSATSPTSRNFAAGVAIARGAAPSGTTEGIFALSAMTRRAHQANVPTPVLDEMRRRLGV